MPRRYQRSRQKGFRLPKGVKCVTRPGRFGNPCDTAAEFRKSLAELVDQRSAFNLTLKTEQLNRMVWIHEHLHELKDTDLACWCPLDAECHADVLIEFANP